MYRSIFEGISYGTNHVVEVFKELNATPEKIYSVGGGTKNTIWSQTTSDVSGLNQILRKKTIKEMTRNHLPASILASGSGEDIVRSSLAGYGFGLGFGVVIDPTATRSAVSK